MATPRALERSIDTLQRLYAVVAGLALAEALKRTVLKGANGAVDVHWSDPQIPFFIAFVVTLIPFVHGMNRHLDDHAHDLLARNRNRMIAMFVLDFMVFVSESCLLVMLAASVDAGTAQRANYPFVNWLIALFVMDVIWSVLRTLGEGTALPKWALINVVAILCCLILICQMKFGPPLHGLVIGALALGRSAADYWLSRDFYFPAE